MMPSHPRGECLPGHLIEAALADQEINARSREGYQVRVAGVARRYDVVTLLFEDARRRCAKFSVGHDQDGVTINADTSGLRRV